MSEPVLSPKGPRYIRNPNCPSGMVDSHTGACVPPKQQPVAKAPAPVAPVQKDVNPPAFNPAIIGIQPDQQTAAFQTCPNGDCSKDYIAGSNRDAQMAINAGGPVNMGQLYALAMIEGAVAPYMKNAQAMNQAMQTNEAMSNPDVVRNIGEYRKQGIAAPMAVALAMQDHNTAYGYNAQAVRNFAEQDKIAQDINSKNLAMAVSAGMPWTGVQTSIGGQGYASDYGGIQSFNRDGERAALGLTSGNTLRVNGTGPLLGVLGATNAGLPAVVNKMETAAGNALAVEQKNKELEGQISLAKWQKQQEIDMKAAEYKHAIAMENIKNSHAEALKKLEAGKQPTPLEMLKLELDAQKAGLIMVRGPNGIEFRRYGAGGAGTGGTGTPANELNNWNPGRGNPAAYPTVP